jgi:hypothetical protein
LREAFFREPFLRVVLARLDVRFLAVRPLLAAFRLGAFAFLPRAEVLRDLPDGLFFDFARAGRFAFGAADGGLGVKVGGGVG